MKRKKSLKIFLWGYLINAIKTGVFMKKRKIKRKDMKVNSKLEKNKIKKLTGFCTSFFKNR